MSTKVVYKDKETGQKWIKKDPKSVKQLEKKVEHVVENKVKKDLKVNLRKER